MTVSPDVQAETPQIRYHSRVAIFESGEHTLLGDSIKLQLPSGTVLAGKHPMMMAPPWETVDQLPMTFGHIVALAGDFYGTPDQPICTAADPKVQFIKCYDTLRNSPKVEVSELLKFINDEVAALNKALKEGKQPSSIYDGGVWDTFKTTKELERITKGRYLKLALHNLDHFGHEAVKAYAAGRLCTNAGLNGLPLSPDGLILRAQ
ncbi:hypothetical protein RXV88_15320 [Aestuariicoccus sp. MJ-SS9]|nr:hypothetical protein [Aestuariicoccus sp. MJ-SS9]